MHSQPPLPPITEQSEWFSFATDYTTVAHSDPWMYPFANHPGRNIWEGHEPLRDQFGWRYDQLIQTGETLDFFEHITEWGLSFRVHANLENNTVVARFTCCPTQDLLRWAVRESLVGLGREVLRVAPGGLRALLAAA